MSLSEERLVPYLQEFLATHSPVGMEREMNEAIARHIDRLGHSFSEDAAGNLIVHLSGSGQASPIHVYAHKDEISLVVKKVEADGSLRVAPLGGARAVFTGDGPVDILGAKEVVKGVLGIGCAHTKDSPATRSVKENGRKEWRDVRVETRLSSRELAKAGVRAGSPVVWAREHKVLSRVGDSLAAYHLDDKVAVALMLMIVEELGNRTLPGDVYAVFTSSEEVGCHGALYAARTLPGEEALAIEVGIVDEEYGTALDGGPILFYKDAQAPYDREFVDHLYDLGEELNLNPQSIVAESFGSDASAVKAHGIIPRTAVIGFPTQFTHSFEMAPVRGMLATAELISEYLQRRRA